MKKSTKKLISIFLSLLMVLSLIPMASMTAFGYQFYTVSISSGGNYDIPEGAYSATSEDIIKIENYSTNDITVFVEYWSESFPLKYFYMGGDTSFTLPAFPAGKHVSNITTNGDNITFTLADDPTTPDWFDDVTAKVDAAASKLVNEDGKTYAEATESEGGVMSAIALLTNPVYTNNGSVYTIRGYLGTSTTNEGELIITLDENGEVASIVVNAYVIGNQVSSKTYAPIPAPAPAPAQSYATSEQFDALSKKFDDLTKTIQNFNITFSQQPAGADHSESAEDIISNAFLGGANK